MQTIIYVILAGILMCCCSVVASFILIIKEDILKKIIFPLVSFSSGVLLGTAFLFLIPESVEHLGNTHFNFFFIIFGFLSFFFLEDLLEWHHCHGTPHEHEHKHEHNHKLGWLITFSDFVHNAIDGAIICATFLISPHLGFVTTLSTFLHELPQEIGDIGILLHSGMTKKKSFLLNLLSQLSFFIGAIFVYIFKTTMLVNFLIPFTAGVFIYISAVDLVPEIKATHSYKTKLFHTLYFIMGICFIFILLNALHH